MKIIIDCREHDLYDNVQNILLSNSMPCSFDIVKENLDIGDIIIKKDDDEIVCIIERKTLNDLMASIKDGRYVEQSFRLSNASDTPNHNIIYLIEGNINSIVNPIEKKTIYTSLTSINLFKGFSITRTQNLKESVDYLLSMGEKISRELSKNKVLFYNKDGINANVLNYPDVVKTAKKQNITKDNIGILMLCQIPGVSTSVATKILADYDSLYAFIDAFKTQSTLLDDFYIKGNTGKLRKLGTNVINSIKTYLL
jgi:ERCC4-type nuclease